MQRAVKFMVDFVVHCAGELHRNDASEMAAALAYRTIFGLVPVVVLALVAFQSFGGIPRESEAVEQWLYEFFGISAIQYEGAVRPEAVKQPTPATDATEGTAPADERTDSAADETAQQIRDRIDAVIGRVHALSFTSIGAVGVLLLIWAAIALAVAVEHSFNRIYGSPEGRPWSARVVVYWTVITLGPLLLFASFYLADLFLNWAAVLPGLGTLVSLLGRGAALAASWLLLFLLFRYMPNTEVRLRPALVGSFVAAVLWEVAKGGFRLYVAEAVPYAKVYGTLGLIPLFLLWVYLSWLIVLFGLEIAYTTQMLSHRRLHDIGGSQEWVIDSAWLVPVAAEVARCFSRGEAADPTHLAEEVAIPERLLFRLLEALERAGIVHRVTTGGSEQTPQRWTLARPAERIDLGEVVRAATRLHGDGTAGKGASLAHKVRETALESHSGRTLAEWL